METIGSILVHGCTSKTEVATNPLGLASKDTLVIGPVTFVFETPHQLQEFLDGFRNVIEAHADGATHWRNRV